MNTIKLDPNNNDIGRQVITGDEALLQRMHNALHLFRSEYPFDKLYGIPLYHLIATNTIELLPYYVKKQLSAVQGAENVQVAHEKKGSVLHLKVTFTSSFTNKVYNI